ncbi:MAG: hypothetical protein K6E59_04035 [Bacilli bacterium]|nr:hypothetical protein [Bacilli bacterium]
MAKKEKKKKGRLNAFWFGWNIIESIILFVGGVLAIVAGALGETSQGANQPISNTVAYVISAFVILDGILRIVLHLAYYEKNDEPTPMMIAGFEISLGTLLIILQATHGLFIEAATHLISIALMVVGALLLVYAIFFIARKLAKLFMPLLEILFSAVLIAVGVTVEILYSTESTRDRLGLIMIGAILVIAAIAIFVIAIITHNKSKKEREEKEAEEPETVEEEPEPQPARKKIKAKKADIVDVTPEEDEGEAEDEKIPQIETKDE